MGKKRVLVSYGVDVDAHLTPPKPAPVKKSTTLDAAAPTTITQKGDKPMTRHERTAHAMANVRARMRQTADQT